MSGLARLAARYWPIPVVILVIIVIIALIVWFRVPRPRYPAWTPALSLALALCVLMAIAGPALRAFQDAGAVASTAFKPLPKPTGRYAVAAIDLVLPGPGTTGGRGSQTMTARLWLPQDERGALVADGPSGLHAPPDDLIKAPLLVYAPGFRGARSAYATLMESLASHGYAVLGVDDLAIERQEAPNPEERDAIDNLFDFSSEDSLARSLVRGERRAGMQAARLAAATAGVRTWLSQHAPAWSSRIGVDRIAVIGSSFGGAAAVEYSLSEPAVAAVVNIDGALFGRAAEGAIDKPYLCFSSDFSTAAPGRLNGPARWSRLQDIRDHRIAAREGRKNSGHVFRVEGARHSSFGDAIYNPKHARDWLLLPPHRARLILEAYLLDFLGVYLQGREPALLNAATSPYPEVRRIN